MNVSSSSTIPLVRQEYLIGIIGTAALASLLLLFQSPFLLLLVLGGLLTLAAFVLWTETIPLVLIVILPFSLEMHITDSTRLTLPTEPLIILIVLAFFFRRLLFGSLPFRASLINLPVLLLYFSMVISLSYTNIFDSTLKALIRDTGYILFAFYIAPVCIRSEQQLKTVCLSGLITHTLIVIYGFITQMINGIRIYDKLAAPFFIEHCIYAAFITFSFAFIIAFQLNQKPGRMHLILTFAGGFVGIAILLTFVRAAWLSVALLLFYYLFQFKNKRSSVDLIVALVILMIAATVLLSISDLGKMFLQRIETIGDTQYVANYDRLDRWSAAWNMAMGNFVYGVGWGAYPDLYPYYRVYEDAFSSGIRMGAHNLYLELFAEIGIIGLIFFLLLIYVFFRQCILLQRRFQSEFLRVFVIALQGAMMTYLFHAFLNNLGPSDKISVVFWFMIGMVPTLELLAEKEGTQANALESPSESS